ncbi:MAG: hypothetical protein NC899_09080, partial [Candidatus Omnitrophica bacterium]|nr:hypothetical protein [Candidatus Omnitrophota bacterium]
PNIEIKRFNLKERESKIIFEAVAEKLNIPEKKRLIPATLIIGFFLLFFLFFLFIFLLELVVFLPFINLHHIFVFPLFYFSLFYLGTTSQKLSQFSSKNLPAVKLILSLFFFTLGIYLLLRF